jgi:hypothetical protein
LFDPDWQEYVIAVACHGEVQSARLGAVERGESRALALSLIENLKEVFKPK